MPIDRGHSIRQPFAWAVCANVKRFENRTWTTDYRGTIAIHTSTSQQNVNELLKYDEDGILRKDSFKFGAIICLPILWMFSLLTFNTNPLLVCF